MEDFCRIFTRSSHKDLRKFTQGPRSGFQQVQKDLHKIFPQEPTRSSSRSSCQRRESHKIVPEGPAREDLTRFAYKNLLSASPKGFHTLIPGIVQIYTQGPVIHGICKIFMQGPFRQDSTRSFTRFYKIFSQGPAQNHARTS